MRSDENRRRRSPRRANRWHRPSPAPARSSTCSPRAPRQAPGPSELARRLGLPKSSIANICNALADAGLVRRVGTGFALGRKLAELGGAYLASVDQVQEFYEACRQLPTGSEETVQLAILDGLEMTYLARHDGRQPVRLTSQIGRRLPATRHGDRQGRARVTRRGRRWRAADGVAELPALTVARSATVDALARRPRRRPGARLRDGRRGDRRGRRLLRRGDPGPAPGEGPYAASITLLKVRATDERVPAL